MLRFFVSVLALVFMTAAIAGEKDSVKCTEGKIRTSAFGETVITRAKICHGEMIENFASASCRNKKCSAFKVRKRYYIHEFLSDVGTPGFKLCRELGGAPEIVDISVDGSWHRTDRCVFKDGFVDTDSLLDFYIDRDDP